MTRQVWILMIAPFGLPQWISRKESACNAGDTEDVGSIPGSGRSSGGERGNPLQYACWENPLDRGAWRATVHGVAVSRTQMKRPSRHTHSRIEGVLISFSSSKSTESIMWALTSWSHLNLTTSQRPQQQMPSLGIRDSVYEFWKVKNLQSLKLW